MPVIKSASDQRDVDKTLTELLSKRASTSNFRLWMVCDTPLITHAWSHKAKDEILAKQVKAVKGGKEARDPDQDFEDSLYKLGPDKNGDETYGFPATAFKRAFLDAAHKDKGIPKTALTRALFIHADMVRVGAAKAGAICDMPMVRIWGTKPEMREDMVKIGGMSKTSTLAYRGQFLVWACKLEVQLNTTLVPVESLLPLIMDAGESCGVGEWRNERGGMFGAFHLADATEAAEWDAFSEGTGPMPVTATSHVAQAAQ